MCVLSIPVSVENSEKSQQKEKQKENVEEGRLPLQCINDALVQPAQTNDDYFFVVKTVLASPTADRRKLAAHMAMVSQSNNHRFGAGGSGVQDNVAWRCNHMYVNV